MNNRIAQTPPMGWNSWDCYGASVREDEVRGNAEYMALHMKEFGWEYVVVDIQWYEPGAVDSAYRLFVPLEMDGYSRLIPATNRFPSSVGGKGFKPLADYVHSLGLKFGIHVMRGIPRQAVHANAPILGSEKRARDIAHPNANCNWNTDMYGVDPAKEGARRYYESVYELYASWGVDFVKVDDLSRTGYSTDPYASEGEIDLIRHAIDRCGRDMVFSLSPGPAPREKTDHLVRKANMWRMTGDYWDRWDDLSAEFEKCDQWTGVGGPGHWPDADMLPVGHIGIRSCEHGMGDRRTRFTRDEQVTMLTLWAIFRSPMMVGCELRDNDEWTLSLLTNPEVLRVLNHSRSARQLFRNGYFNQHVGWTAEDEDGSLYLALFNTFGKESDMEVPLSLLGAEGSFTVRDLWKREDIGVATDSVVAKAAPHGARLFRLSAR